MTYLTIGPTELEPEGNGVRVQVLSSRSSGGWSSKDIATPHNEATLATPGAGFEYRYFSPALSLAMVEPQGPFTSLSAEATERTPYIRDNAGCAESPATCYTPLVTATNVPPGTQFGGNPKNVRGEINFVGTTSDLNHVVIRSSVGLTSTPGDEGGLYEWASGRIQLVSILPAGEGGASDGSAQFGYHAFGVVARNAISSDGTRIFWTSSNGGLYMRDTAKGETVRIGSGQVDFRVASVDGSRVFYVTEGYGGHALEECDIMEASGTLTCKVTRLVASVEPGVLGASEDGSFVYFVSNSALATGAVSGTCNGGFSTASDRCNLYVEHDSGAGWEVPKLIGVLSGADGPSWAAHTEGNALSNMASRVSSDGHWLAFMSQRPLTGYDTHDAVTGQPDEEVYLYDAIAERLLCASCNPTGARPTGHPGGGYFDGFLGGGPNVWSRETMLAANIPGWTPFYLETALYQSRYLSDEGRLFFNSHDALVPQDVNGTGDVYEYEPPGLGGCTSTAQTFSVRADGCVDLVSSGRSPDESAFMDASETGNDVFFMTTSRLATQDFDTSYDVYDAHVCSASAPCAAMSASPPPCSTGDSCKTAPSPQPSVFGAPSSATFAGIGNLSASSEGAKPRSVSRSQRLKRALKACHRKRSKRKRAACERKARKQHRTNKATRGNR